MVSQSYHLFDIWFYYCNTQNELQTPFRILFNCSEEILVRMLFSNRNDVTALSRPKHDLNRHLQLGQQTTWRYSVNHIEGPQSFNICFILGGGGGARVQISTRRPAILTGFSWFSLVPPGKYAGIVPYIRKRQHPSTSFPVLHSLIIL
jgi:hypothetical protein